MGWQRSAEDAKRPNGSVTTCVENCTLAESRGNRPSRARSSRVGVSPTPVLLALRRPYGARGGGEYSEGRRSMHNDQAAQDAARLLVAFSTNHPEARTASPHGLDRPFSPSWADAEQAGLDRARRDTAMRWLVDENMLEREEEAEDLLGTGEGLHSEYGAVFRITDTGRELLEEAWERRPE
jgi:hypothetical protein